MSLSDQTKQAARSFEVSNHAFLKLISNALSQKLLKDHQIEMKTGGKVVHGKAVSVILTGTKVIANPKEAEETADKVRQTFNELQNTSDLLELIDHGDS